MDFPGTVKKVPGDKSQRIQHIASNSGQCIITHIDLYAWNPAQMHVEKIHFVDPKESLKWDGWESDAVLDYKARSALGDARQFQSATYLPASLTPDFPYKQEEVTDGSAAVPSDSTSLPYPDDVYKYIHTILGAASIQRHPMFADTQYGIDHLPKEELRPYEAVIAESLRLAPVDDPVAPVSSPSGSAGGAASGDPSALPQTAGAAPSGDPPTVLPKVGTASGAPPTAAPKTPPAGVPKQAPPMAAPKTPPVGAFPPKPPPPGIKEQAGSPLGLPSTETPKEPPAERAPKAPPSEVSGANKTVIKTEPTTEVKVEEDTQGPQEAAAGSAGALPVGLAPVAALPASPPASSDSDSSSSSEDSSIDEEEEALKVLRSGLVQIIPRKIEDSAQNLSNAELTAWLLQVSDTEVLTDVQKCWLTFKRECKAAKKTDIPIDTSVRDH